MPELSDKQIEKRLPLKVQVSERRSPKCIQLRMPAIR